MKTMIWGVVLIIGSLYLQPFAYSQHDHSHSLQPIDVELKTNPQTLQTHTPATLVFSIKNDEGKPLQGLTITHERILHTVIVSADFSVFAHVHPENLGPITPEMKKDARFPVRYTFPKAGRYLIAVDFAVGDQHDSKQFFVDVVGEPKMGSLKKDFSRERSFGDYQVKLSASPDPIIAGQEATLNYVVEKNGEPVTVLEPYLAAPMHIAVISTDLKSFTHAHGELPGASSMEHAAGHAHGSVPDQFGPTIEAHIVFPTKGLYQIFSELKHDGKIIVTQFMVKVNPTK